MATIPEFLKDLKDQMKSLKVKKVEVDPEDISPDQDEELNELATNVVHKFGSIMKSVNMQMIDQGIVFKNPKKHLDFVISRTMDILESMIHGVDDDSSKN